jgi:hypothetical protein
MYNNRNRSATGDAILRVDPALTAICDIFFAELRDEVSLNNVYKVTASVYMVQYQNLRVKKGPRTTEFVCSVLSLIGGVYIGARALLDINLIWFG